MDKLVHGRSRLGAPADHLVVPVPLVADPARSRGDPPPVICVSLLKTWPNQ